MAFFSTASRSPIAGTATAGLRDLTKQREQKRQFDIQNQARLDELIAKKQEEARLKNLSQSLLGLKNYDQENVTAWAIANSVSADELTALEPVMKQREQQTEYVDIETPTQTGQVELKTGKKVLTDKPKAEPRLIDEEDDTWVWQRNPVTNEITGRARKPEGVTGTAAGKKKGLDKVADWYLKTKAEIEKAYYGDNLEPTDIQRQNFDRAMLRAESLIMETAESFNIPHEAAVPYAMSQIRQEKVWTVDAEQSLPPVNRGAYAATSSTDETIEAIQQMQRNGIPSRIIGEALTNKGWNATETAKMMETAAQLVSASQAGFNVTKLKNTPIAVGQSIRDPKGVLWTRQGDFLVSEDGRKVRK